MLSSNMLMLFEMSYCMLTGGACAHNIVVKINSFFIAEPYDEERECREQAILSAIDGFSYYIADKEIMNIAMTCKVCREIQSSQFGIVELTGLNENVLIELGMMYGFGKPVIILLKKEAEKPKIKIPSNIIGLEQIRYVDFSDLSEKLEQTVSKLMELIKRGKIQMLDVIQAFKKLSELLEIQIYSKNLESRNFKSRILEFKAVGSSRIAILDRGKPHGVRIGMLFKVYRTDLELESGRTIERFVGIIQVTHSQKEISQAIPIQMIAYKDFWADALIGKTLPKNVVTPLILKEFEETTIERLEEIKNETIKISRHLTYFI